MANYAEYFASVAYKAKWSIGDRVFGHYKKIPFVGTVGNDSLVSLEEGPRVSVHLDLPLLDEEQYRRLIFVKPNQLKRLMLIQEEQEPLKLPAAGSIPAKRTKQKKTEEPHEKRKTKPKRSA